MAKKTIKKTEPKLVKPEVVQKVEEKKETWGNDIAKLNARLDRIVAAISKAKSIKGM